MSLIRPPWALIYNHNFWHFFLILISGEIVHGGKFDEEKLFFEPTIVKNITLKDSLMQEEIFGPILLLIECENVNEAIDMINTQPTPLAAYCFTKGINLLKLSMDSGFSNAGVFKSNKWVSIRS